MRWHAGFFLLGCLFIMVAAASAADRVYIDSAITRRLIDAQTAILNDQFSRADSLAGAIVTDFPNDPSGYVTMASTVLAQMSYNEEDLYADHFKRLLDTIQRLCTDQLTNADHGRKAWLYLFLGHTQAYRSLYEAKFGSSFAAMKAGLRTRSLYSAGLAEDSGLVDLYFGLGSYHYWKSVKAGLLRWLGIFRNDIALGLDELRLAADSSVLSRDISLGALAWIWLDREKYDSTLAVVERLGVRYPEGSSFLWPAAQALYSKKDFDRAHAVFLNLRDKLAARPGNYFNLVECDYFLSCCREKSDSPQAAWADAARLNEYERYIPPATRRRQEGKLRYLQRLLEKAESTALRE
jgi:hypothetical protein